MRWTRQVVAYLVLNAACLGLWQLGATGARAQAPATGTSSGNGSAPTPKSKNCIVDTTQPSPGETALNKKDFAAAEKILRDALSTNASNGAVHEALVRTLLEEDKLAEGAHEADSWAAAAPEDSMALVAQGDARLRQGDPRGAFALFSKANTMDICNARSVYGLAQVSGLAGYHATAQRDIEQAYRLHPTDNDIYTGWIESRQRVEQLRLLAAYAEHSDQMNDTDRAELKQRLAKESLYHTGDCRMAPTSPRKTSVPMSPLYNDWGLDLWFNGKRRNLTIDTGASGITISRSAALFLGLVREDQTRTAGIGDADDSRTSIAHVASIKIGDMEFLNCPVQIVEKWLVFNSDGLIGADVFDQSQVTLDFPRARLRIDPLPDRPGETHPVPQAASEDNKATDVHDPYVAPEMADWMRIYRSGHQLLIPTGIVETKQMKDDNAWKSEIFLLDTGSESNIISPRAAREVTNVSRDYFTGMSGLSGEVNEVFLANKFTLSFARLRVDAFSMTAVDLTKISHNVGVEVSGLIGAPTLYRLVMHIDYRDNLMKFEYDPKKTGPDCLYLGGGEFGCR